MTSADITIRELRPDDLTGVLAVLRRALGETAVLRRTPELWRWKHESNPFGESLVVVAESEGRIAGVRAMMRWDLVTRDGKTIRCLRPVDTATDPDFARRGIFTRLTESALERASGSGIDLVFNTPNEASGAGYLKMGWKQVGPIGVMVRPLLRRGDRVPDDQPPEPSAFFDEALEQFIPVADRAPRGLRTPRTDAYMRWRFTGHPTVRYRMLGRSGQVAVVRPNLRSGRKEIVISELFGDRPGVAVRGVAGVGRASYLAGWFSPGSPERRGAVLGGLIPVPGVSALTLMAHPLTDLPVDVFSLREWDIGLGDLELL